MFMIYMHISFPEFPDFHNSLRGIKKLIDGLTRNPFIKKTKLV